MKEALDIGKGYKEKYGFHDEEKSVFKSKKGLNHQVVDDISDHKNEPDWMRDFRHKSLDIFLSKPMPTWGGKLDDINFDEIFYYLKPSDHKGQTWEDVPAEIKRTFDKLGIPESEQKFLAGAGAQYESESVYHNLKKEWEDKGVIFLDTDSALKDHPEIFRKFFATIVPPDDNKFSALNSAVWSGGSFLYVPPGVHVDLPLQAYFRINAKNVGQFERTLLIVDKGAQAHYVEGCFVKGTKITTNPDYKNIEEIKIGEKVLTHTGDYKRVYHVQERPYSGDLYTIEVYGDATQQLQVTEAHPFVAIKRERSNERNRNWKSKWVAASELSQRDYLAIPVDKRIESSHQHLVTVPIGNGSHGYKNLAVPVPSTRSFFRLAGYFLAEGSVSGGHYLQFSFHEKERSYIEDVKSLLKEVFQVEKINETHHKANRGTNVVVCSTALARVFVSLFGKNAFEKKIPEWMRWEEPVKQRELITALFRGDGNYYCGQNKHGRKELFRISTISETLVHQVRDMLLRLGVVGAINCQKNRGGNRKPMFNVCIGGEQAEFFGALVGTTVQHSLNGKKRATMFHIDEHFAYLPIKKISKRRVKDIPVYNFGVDGDESYVAGGVAVHNCTAPSYSTDSLHSAVVEVIVMEGARFRYTTIQNWSANVYNLVTKRSKAYKDSTMEWVDANLGCLTADAQVFLNPKGPISIAEVKAGDSVYAVDLNDLKPKRFKVNAVQCTGVKKTYRLTTQNFRTVKATANHPFLTLTKDAYSAYPKLSWQPLENLKEGSLIAMLTALPDEGKPYPIDYQYPKIDGRGLKTPVTLPQETSEELMWLLGLYLGDGFIERSGGRARRVYFAVPPKDRARSRLVQTLENVFKTNWKPKGISVTVSSAVLADFILYLGFDGTAKSKQIPKWIYSLPLRQKLAFIEGYMEADGHVRRKKMGEVITEMGQLAFASVNKKLLEELKLLMISCGLNPLKISTYSKKRQLLDYPAKEYTTHYLTLNLKENLEKIRKKEANASMIQFTRVRSIEPEGEEPVYDIEVDGAHNFIANGLIVHNSKLTMKYPSIYLMEPGAKGDILSVAFAGAAQHQDAGGKIIHCAPNTSSHVLSKSVSQHGGRSSYRGLVKVYPGCKEVKSTVRCDALLMDKDSRSDTYPYMEIDEKAVTIGHEATVSKIGDEQLFYLRSRGLSEEEANSMIVSGFIEPIVKELPMEYAVEMNRLIQLQMEGSVG